MNNHTQLINDINRIIIQLKTEEEKSLKLAQAKLLTHYNSFKIPIPQRIEQELNDSIKQVKDLSSMPKKYADLVRTNLFCSTLNIENVARRKQYYSRLAHCSFKNWVSNDSEETAASYLNAIRQAVYSSILVSYLEQCCYAFSQYPSIVDKYLELTFFESYSEQTDLTSFIQSTYSLLENTIVADHKKAVEEEEKYNAYIFWVNICALGEHVSIVLFSIALGLAINQIALPLMLPLALLFAATTVALFMQENALKLKIYASDNPMGKGLLGDVAAFKNKKNFTDTYIKLESDIMKKTYEKDDIPQKEPDNLPMGVSGALFSTPSYFTSISYNQYVRKAFVNTSISQIASNLLLCEDLNEHHVRHP